MDEPRFAETMSIRYEPRTDPLLRGVILTVDEGRALSETIGLLIGKAWDSGYKVIIDYKV